jgi:hypothetical protein
MTILEAKSPHGSGSSYPPVLQIRMCDTECIEKAALITGYGSASPEQEPPSQEGQRGSYQWRIHGRKAADIIAEIYPHLLIKRKQAIVAWNHQAIRDGYETKRGVKIPKDALEKQIACRELIQRINRREAVDIPSWMKEPPLPIGPGWYLRQDLIWAKPNPMPESVRDRCTKAHEYIFLLTKSSRYYYNAEAIFEPALEGTDLGILRGKNAGGPGADKIAWHANSIRARQDAGVDSRTANTRVLKSETSPRPVSARNKRSVWTIATRPYAEAHFATFPQEIPELCIKAGCPKGGKVLDPFFGAGTTGLVAMRLGREFIGVDLSPAYCEMARKRIYGTLMEAQL